MTVNSTEMMSKAAFARHRGVSKPLISKWARQGRLVLTDEGMVNVVATEAALASTRDPARGGRRVRGETSVQTASAPAPAPSTMSGGPSQPPSYTQVRTAREAFAVKNAEVAYRLRVGELVEWSAVERALSQAMGPIVSNIRSLSSRLAIRVAAESDVRTCTALLDGEVDTVCQAAADATRRFLEARGQP